MKFLITFVTLMLFMVTIYANGNSENNSDIVTSNEVYSQTQKQQQSASQWGLSDKEWSHYQKKVLSSPRALQSPGIDPIMALGLEAGSAAERRHFAELWVKQEAIRVEKELAFQREVDAAWKRLYPSLLPVNTNNSGTAAVIQNTSLPVPARLALFVRQDCGKPCDSLLELVLTDGRPVDIYFTDSDGNDTAVRQWALSHHIPVEKVRTRHVTLNHDSSGYWSKFGQEKMPVVLTRGENGWQVVPF